MGDHGGTIDWEWEAEVMSDDTRETGWMEEGMGGGRW